MAATGGGTALGQTQATNPVAAKARVPNLHNKWLPLAEDLLRKAGLRVGREDCNCSFGVVFKRNWYVCRQRPVAGARVARGTRVWTYSARDLDDC